MPLLPQTVAKLLGRTWPIVGPLEVPDIFLSLLQLLVPATVDVDADGESLLVLTSWTTLVEALRCLSPLILTISRISVFEVV